MLIDSRVWCMREAASCAQRQERPGKQQTSKMGMYVSG
jgi:hypothetical protein